MKKQKKVLVLTILSIVFTGISLFAQTPICVTGKVLDYNANLPVKQVTITISQQSRSVSTDELGFFQFCVQLGWTVVFSKPGYQSEIITVNQNYLEILLKPESMIPSHDLTKATSSTEGVYSVNEEIRSVRGNQSDGQVVIIDGVRIQGNTKHSSDIVHTFRSPYDNANNESYGHIVENEFQKVKDEALSTFSLDVDAASYSNMRRMLNQGQLPPTNAIRTEELINYFHYDYAEPSGTDPVLINTEIATCQWNKEHYLVKIGVKAKNIPVQQLPPSNFVFLIDVSGSMYGPTRLELVKSSLKLLTNNLRKEDRVAIVVYAGAAGEVLASTLGNDKQKIMEAVNNLTAGGSTAGGAGIELAYKIAQKNFINEGNNRVILCTDGDFNVGVSSEKGLETLIEEKRETGIFLTVLGYGMGNYKDNNMQTLAQKGNGNHAYIDNLQEANKVLVKEFCSTMYAVAKDVKIQIEFNPAHIAQYRLIGYETRLLNKEDFNDDTKDAGELGAGHTVTALYELIPVGVKSRFNTVDPLKYQDEKMEDNPVNNSFSDELLTVKLRYKEINSDKSQKIEQIVRRKQLSKTVSPDFNFIQSVALFGQLLHRSDFVQGTSFDDVITLARQGLGNDEQGYRREFVRLAETAKGVRN
ncbi:MAG: von Willebrand factor type A domain-containing protein [Bacteroidales bacterium]|jgi:Ca-activated chloride channel family protein|nr:von Willebrand factor type A domain-containing protein [Bacteroidales bacterium]